MPVFPLNHLRIFWRRCSRPDRAALAVVLFYALERLALRLGWRPPEAGPLGFFLFSLGFAFFASLAYLALRGLGWLRTRLLWSLRNRLLVAYVFIAVVPVLLLLTMAGVTAYLVYLQLGAHLFYDDLQERRVKLVATTDSILGLVLSGSAQVPPGRRADVSSSPALRALVKVAERELPGLRIEANPDGGVPEGGRNVPRERAARLVQRGAQLWLESSAAGRMGSGGSLVVITSVPVTSEFLETLAPELGPIQLTLTEPTTEASPKGLVFERNGRRFVPAGQISTRRRTLAPPADRLDVRVNGATTLEAVRAEAPEGAGSARPIFASFSVRPSQLNRRLFSSLGELSDVPVLFLISIGVLFLILEVAALVTGIVLTRTITHAVADLYAATMRVQSGDFTPRIPIRRRDQLGALGESFNLMTSSIAELIEEQRERQRLENEITIAREVQEQLFPKALPSLPGIELAAICRAARVVSGDYYDFIPLDSTRLALAIADISGKGISAALLMASLQAALRSQVLLDGNRGQSTAELVARLNRHLYLNTADDRFATLFYAVYDSATRTLRYTNAGHLPPVYVCGEQVKKLEEGGLVVGVFDETPYQEGTLEIEPGGLLVAYSDGLVEPENVFGEQFGVRRIVEEVLRHRDLPPQRLASHLVTAVEEWAGSPEQADDMTVVVARIG